MAASPKCDVCGRPLTHQNPGYDFQPPRGGAGEGRALIYVHHEGCKAVLASFIYDALLAARAAVTGNRL